MDLERLHGTIVDPVKWDQIYWATTEGITSADWSLNAKRWVHLVSKRILPLSNHMDITYPWVLVVCVL